MDQTQIPPEIDAENAPLWGQFQALEEKTIRIKFVRKVYGIIFVQLLITFGIVSLFVFYEPIKAMAKTPVGASLYVVSYMIFFMLVLFLSCPCPPCIRAARSYPTNYILFALVTLALSFMLGMISSYHDTQTVLIALIITILVTLGVTLFSMQTKIDFTRHWFALFCLSLAFISFTFIFSIAIWLSTIAQAIYGGLGALLMILFLAIDTQMLIGGKRKLQYSQEDYVYVSLQIYLDICYIFIYILTALGSRDNQ